LIEADCKCFTIEYAIWPNRLLSKGRPVFFSGGIDLHMDSPSFENEIFFLNRMFERKRKIVQYKSPGFTDNNSTISNHKEMSK
jgi:hypothetical protein